MYAKGGSRQHAALVAAIGAALVLPPSATAAPFKNFQANSAHTGHHRGDSLRPPLKRAWTRHLGGSTSYPVIVSGRIFVTVDNPGYRKNTLFALVARTGRTLWSHVLRTSSGWSNATYGSGRLITITDAGDLAAYRPKTGAVVWKRRISGARTAPPTASRGVVYVSTWTQWYSAREDTATGGVYAIRIRDGKILWRRPVYYGDSSSPTVNRRSVFENYGCGQVYALDRRTGATDWHFDTGCAGGGGQTTTLYRGELWTRDTYERNDAIVFDARTGVLKRHFKPSLNPTFARGIGYFVRYPGMDATNASTGKRIWRTKRGSPYITPPVIAGGIVYVGALSGRVFAFDAKTGAFRWSGDTGASFDGDITSSVGQPTNAFGVGAGLLVTPNARGVIAYRERR